MKLGIILFLIGSVLTLYLANLKFKKRFFTKVGIVFGILLLIYGVILIVQPNDYIKYTKTTISKDTNLTNK